MSATELRRSVAWVLLRYCSASMVAPAPEGRSPPVCTPRTFGSPSSSETCSALSCPACAGTEMSTGLWRSSSLSRFTRATCWPVSTVETSSTPISSAVAVVLVRVG